jgi:hypothetical protein
MMDVQRLKISVEMTLLDHLDGAMIIAVIAVWVMQVAIDEVVDVVAVRDGLVAAAGAVDVIGLVAAALMSGGAGRGVLLAHGDGVLVIVAVVGVVQVAVVEVVDVTIVTDGGVAAVGAVDMIVVVVGVVAHGVSFVGGSGLGVVEDRAQQRGGGLVADLVEDVFAVAGALEQARVVEVLEALRDGAGRLLAFGDEL